MLTFRSFILDGVALTGVAVGVMAGVGGYVGNLPDPPERVALAAAAVYDWPDPETTGAITPRDAGGAVRHGGGRAGVEAPSQDRAGDEVRAWVDPPRRSARPRGE